MTVASAEAGKRSAAIRAAEYIEDGMVLGLGTGSTVRYLLEELGARVKRGELRTIVGVPTSEDTANRARALGIPITSLTLHPCIDLTIDGADEVDPRLDVVKGLGGALMREKVVASVSREFIIIVDSSKIVTRLGTRAPLPVEVDPFAAPVLIPFFQRNGAEPVLRRDQLGEPFRTDGGNLIFDCHFESGIPDPGAMDRLLNCRPGVLETGLFIGMVSRVVVADPTEIRVLSRGDG